MRKSVSGTIINEATCILSIRGGKCHKQCLPVWCPRWHVHTNIIWCSCVSYHERLTGSCTRASLQSSVLGRPSQRLPYLHVLVAVQAERKVNGMKLGRMASWGFAILMPTVFSKNGFPFITNIQFPLGFVNDEIMIYAVWRAQKTDSKAANNLLPHGDHRKTWTSMPEVNRLKFVDTSGSWWLGLPICVPPLWNTLALLRQSAAHRRIQFPDCCKAFLN